MEQDNLKVQAPLKRLRKAQRDSLRKQCLPGNLSRHRAFLPRFPLSQTLGGTGFFLCASVSRVTQTGSLSWQVVPCMTIVYDCGTLQGSPKQIQFMDTTEDDWSWQQVLRREGKVGQAWRKALSDNNSAAPSLAISLPQHRLHIATCRPPSWLCLGLGTHKVSW